MFGNFASPRHQPMQQSVSFGKGMIFINDLHEI